MKRLSAILLLLYAFCARAQFYPMTNEVNGMFDDASYDTDGMFQSHPFATYFYDMNPGFTNHIYSCSRSGSASDADFDYQFFKWYVPEMAAMNTNIVTHYFVEANDNGGFNSNATYVAMSLFTNFPPLSFQPVALVLTNEGVAVPQAVMQPLGRAPHDSAGGDGGSVAGNAGSMGLAQTLGVPVIDLQHMMNTANFEADQSGARLMWSPIGGSHFSLAGYLAMDIFILQGLNVETNVGSITLNWGGAAVGATDHATVSGVSLAGNTLSCTVHFARMPMAWDVPGTVLGSTITNDARNAFVVYPELGNAFRWTIQVTNLPSGTYNVSVDGTLTDTATASELSAGRNWFTNYNGPLWLQRASVLWWKRQQAGADPVTLISHSAGNGGILGSDLVNIHSAAGNTTEVYPAQYTGTNYINYMAPRVADIQKYDAQIFQAAQQTNHTLSITLISPVKHPRIRK